MYLKNILQSYQESLISCQNKPIEEFLDKNEKINYWSEKIQKIKSEISDNNFEKV